MSRTGAHTEISIMETKLENTSDTSPAGQSPVLALATGSALSFIAAKDDDLARDMACFLWACSRLRHGLFTPPEFIPLVSARLREYLTTHAPNVGDEPRAGNALTPKK